MSDHPLKRRDSLAPADVQRRNLLIGSIAMASVSLLSPITAWAQTSVAFPGIPYLASSDPRFASLVDKYFPGLRSLPDFDLMANHILLCKNDTGRTVRAFTSEWDLCSPKGVRRTVKCYHVTKSRAKLRVAGPRGWSRLLVGRRPIAESGSYFVVSPFFCFSDLAYNHLIKAAHPPKLLRERAKRSRQLLRFISSNKSLPPNARIIAAAFSGGDFFTTDESAQPEEHLRHFFVKRKAEQDEASNVLKLLTSGMAPQQIKAKLKHRRSVKINKQIQGHHRDYARARRRYAAQILHYWKGHGQQRTKTVLTHVLKVPYNNPQRLTASSLQSLAGRSTAFGA